MTGDADGTQGSGSGSGAGAGGDGEAWGRAWRSGPAAGRAAVAPGAGCRCRGAVFLPGDIDERPEVTSPEAAVELLARAVGGSDRERCVVALLDVKHRLLDVVTVSLGSLDHTFMAPREIMRDALLANAAALVLAHNHPSGDPEPSRDDEAVTARLVEAGHLMGITVLDHLVIGGSRWVSLARRGLL